MSERSPINIEPDGDDADRVILPPSKARVPRWAKVLGALLAATAVVLGFVASRTAAESGDAPLPMVRIDRPVTTRLGADESLGVFLATRGVDTAALYRQLVEAGVDPWSVPRGQPVALQREPEGPGLRSISFQADEDTRVEAVMDLGAWRVRVDPITWRGELRLLAGAFDDTLGTVPNSATLALLSPAAALGLSEKLGSLLSWQIDVGGQVAPLDSFRLVAMVEQASDGRQRVGDIRAVDLFTKRRRITAYKFSTAAGAPFAFFDSRGRPVGRVFLRAPLMTRGRLSSTYLKDRVHPVLGKVRAHRGVDYPAPEGTPVVAAAAGTVRFAGVGGDLGNFIDLNHGGGISTRYGHLSRISDAVVDGARVRRGQVIGQVGATGLATAPHLHYEFRVRGSPIDMRLLDVDPTQPIDQLFRKVFDEERARLDGLLGATSD